MLKIKVTEPSGASIEYQSEQELDVVSLGHPAESIVEIEDISYEHELSQVLAKRKSLYPSPEEFLNAFFDGGEQALEELRQQRLAVKAANPKPIKE